MVGPTLFVEDIWDSIAEDQDPLPLSEAQRQDVVRRVAEYVTSPQAGSSREEVKT
ncbi:MAG: addiction module protein [Gemmataceae bacterium]